MAMPIPYIREFEFTRGVLQPVSANVRRLVANNPGPFSGWGTNVYVIGHGTVCVIDPGPDNDAHFANLLEQLGGETVSRVFVTHHHMDHSPMAPRLAAHFGCKTYGFGPPLTQSPGGNVRLEAGDDLRFAPDVRLDDGQTFALAEGGHIEAVHTPGHTSNHVCYAVLPDNGLVCGDHIMAWATSVVSPPDGNMRAYLDSLEKVLGRQYDTLWPAHGAPITDPAPFIRAYIAHRHARNAQIIECLRAGQSKISAMVPVIYADVDKRLHPAACHSVLAHMIYMLEKGEVTCSGTPGLGSDYFLA